VNGSGFLASIVRDSRPRVAEQVARIDEGQALMPAPVPLPPEDTPERLSSSETPEPRTSRLQRPPVPEAAERTTRTARTVIVPKEVMPPPAAPIVEPRVQTRVRVPIPNAPIAHAEAPQGAPSAERPAKAPVARRRKPKTVIPPTAAAPVEPRVGQQNEAGVAPEALPPAEVIVVESPRLPTQPRVLEPPAARPVSLPAAPPPAQTPATASRREEPRVHIGVVEVVVAAPAEKQLPPAATTTAPASNLASRRYLRSL
jgi:hypothetical protein